MMLRRARRLAALPLLLLLSGAGRADDQQPAASADAGAGLAIHLISGADEYDSEPSLKKLQALLSQRYRVTSTASWGHDGMRRLEGLEALKDAELLVLYARRLNLDEDQMQVVRQHWQKGKPIVAIRTACHAFQQADNELFDRKVLGGNYRGHYRDEPVTVVNSNEEHPVLKGVGPIRSTKLYKLGPLAPGAKVLQHGDIGIDSHPVTLVHEYNGGRVFFTTLGVPSDFDDDDFQRLLINAVFWTTHRDPAKMTK